MAARKLSGAARRKLRRERLLQHGVGSPPGAARMSVVPRPTVGPLNSVADVAREARRILYEVRRGLLPSEEGTKQAFVATAALRATHIEEEMARVQAVAELLQRHVGGQPLVTYVEPVHPVADIEQVQQ